MYSHIIVPLDGSEFSQTALPLALLLAEGRRAVVELVHVHEPAQATAGGHVLSPRLDDEERRVMHDRLTALAADTMRRTGLAVIPRFLDGDVLPELQRFVADSGADLVVMTSHGRGGLSRLWFGSVTEGLLRSAHVPILLVRPAHRQPPSGHFGRILVPLEHSRIAEEVLPHALALAELGKIEVLLVSVVDPTLAIGPTAVDLRLDSGPGEPLLESLARIAGERLATLAAVIQPRGITVKTEVITDAFPAQCILASAEKHGVDLIALTTHARGTVGRLFVGATADKIMRGAHCPVLVVHPHVAPPDASHNVARDAALERLASVHA